MNQCCLSRDFTMESERLLFQAPRESEFEEIFRASRVPGFNEGMIWDPPESIEEMREPLRNMLEAWDQGRAFTFSILSKADSGFIGRISIRQQDTDPELTWNIGYFTVPVRQGCGYMSEALSRILRFGFETLGAEQIEAAYAIWNAASGRVLEKNGMKFLRVIEQGFQKRGEWVAENLCGINVQEWKQASTG